MDLIYGFAACLCITLLGAGAFALLVPKGSLEGTVKFALSLFLVADFSFPFSAMPPIGIGSGTMPAGATRSRFDSTDG